MRAATAEKTATTKCDACGWTPSEWAYDITSRLQHALQFMSAFVEGRQLDGSSDRSRSHSRSREQQLAESLREVVSILHPANMLLGHMLSTVSKAAAAVAYRTADHRAAAQLIQVAVTMQRVSLLCLQHHYPPTAPALGFAQLDLAAALEVQALIGRLNNNMDLIPTIIKSEAEAVRAQAMHILRLHFGNDEAKRLWDLAMGFGSRKCL
jgi:hypothetical protein